MKKSLLMAAACLTMAAGAETLDIAAGGVRHAPKLAPEKLGVAALPDGSGQGLAIKWSPTASDHIAWTMNQPLTFASANLKIKAKFYAMPGCPLTRMGVRLADAENETFQYLQNIDFKKGGVFTLEWDLSRLDAASWGEKNNKVIDLPLKFYGFGVDYDRTAPDSAIYLISCDVTEVVAGTPLAIDLAKGATKIIPGGDKSPLTGDDRGLKVQFDPKAAPYIELVLKDQPTVQQFAAAKALAKVEVPAGSPLRGVSFRVVDAGGEVFQFGTAGKYDFKNGGEFELVWPVTPTSANGSWGGRNDKVMDFPIRVQAVTFDYDRAGAPSEIAIKSLSITPADGKAAPAADKAAAAVVKDGFDVNAGMTKYVPGDKNNYKMQVADAPDNAGKAVEIVWTPAASNYIELVLGKMIKLPEFTSATVKLKFYVPANCPVTGIGFRMRDAGDETFQFHKTVDFSKPGIVEVTIPVTPTNFNANWGGRNDKILDQPATISGFGLDYRKVDGEAKLYLLDLSVEVSGGAPVASANVLHTFGDTDLFRTLWGSATLSQGGNGMAVNRIGAESTLTERGYELFFYDALPLKIELEGELASGNNVRAEWFFRDAKNNVIKSGEQVFAANRGKLVFPLDSLKDAKLPLRIERLVLRSDAGENAAVILRKATMFSARPVQESVDFDILTDSKIHVLRKGFEKALKFAFTNTANVSGNYTFDVEMTNFDGKKINQKFAANLQPGETKVFAPELPLDQFGHWTVSAAVREASNPESVYRVKRSFVYLDPAGPTPGRAPGFLLGVNCHITRWSDADRAREIEAVGICGAKVVRDSVDWSSIQPRRGEWNFSRMDDLVGSLSAQGVELQALFAFGAKWAAKPEFQDSKNWLDWSRNQPELNAWREYCRVMAERYRGKIRFWEVWNEPDLSGFNKMSLQEYVDLQKASYEEVKKVAPESLVMTGGFATMSDHPGRKSPTFQRDYLELAKGYFDIHAYHEHGSFLAFVKMVDSRFLPMRKETNTTVPWYANETAINSMGGSERAQALTLFKKMLFSWARGSIGYTWYDMRDDGFDPLDGEHSYGMMTNDFFPKPVYAVFNMLAKNYTDAEFVRQLDIGDNRWLFEFKSPAGVLLPNWDESSFSSTLALAVKSDADSSAVIDLMGNARPQPVLDNVAMLEVNQMPSTLRLDKATYAKILGPLLTVDSSGVAVSGKPFAVSVKMLNPLTAAHDYTLKIKSMPAGFDTAESERTIAVKAGGEGAGDFQFTVGPGFKVPYGSTAQMLIDYEITGTPWRGTLTVPVNPAVWIPQDKPGRPADFVLDQRTQVVSLTAADPAMSHRIWTGPEDLSAQIRLSDTGSAFRLQADVTDDVHSQPERGFNCWKADNIQFAFQLPGQKGYWEIGLAQNDDGQSDIFVYQTPDGFDPAAVVKGLKLKTKLDGKVLHYDFEMAYSAVGITPAVMRHGFRFNLLVNDSDGQGRDGWIHIAPGIGENKNPDRFPFVMFEGK